MQKGVFINEIKLLELKLNALKVKAASEEPEIKPHTSANLYGLLKGSEDITPEDIEAVKIKFKESSR